MTSATQHTPERAPESTIARAFWARQKWLLLRRLAQALVLLAFLSGPWFGVWVLKGNLSASLLFDTVPLTDPFQFVQQLAARHWPYTTAITGAVILLVFYLLVGGRVFCSWVCPVNVVTDAAAWSRRRLGIKTGRAPDSNTRYWLLGGVLIAAAASGALVWEWVNPVTYVQRSLIFGLTGGVWLALGIFLYDLLVAGRGWCGHLCPMGAFYGLLGHTALLRVSAAKRSACNDCMDCFTVCPEPQVIRPALKQVGQQSPIILSGECTACGRCIDVCDLEVFKMTHRFDQRSE